jgi:hypothetical protein
MAGCLYYLPGESSNITVATVRSLGLSYAFETDRCSARGVTRGPEDSGPGVVVADPLYVPDHLIRFESDQQTWLKLPGCNKYVGMYTDEHRPGSTDLQRSTVLPGHLVTLGDGNDWICPIARGHADEEDALTWHNALPQARTIDPEGNWILGDVVDKYRALWDTACRFWDVFNTALTEAGAEKSAESKQEVSFSFADENDAALRALPANYRVGKAEVALLGLFNTQAVSGILRALIDWPTAEKWLQKKTATNASMTAVTSPTGDGQADDTEDTGPHS